MIEEELKQMDKEELLGVIKAQKYEIENKDKVINGMIENEEKYLLEINKLKSIIKEVREYEGSKEHYEDDFDTEIEKVYKILDKENKND